MSSFKHLILSSATLSLLGIILGVLIVWIGVADGIANLIQLILFKLKIIKSFNPILSKRKRKKRLAK